MSQRVSCDFYLADGVKLECFGMYYPGDKPTVGGRPLMEPPAEPRIEDIEIFTEDGAETDIDHLAQRAPGKEVRWVPIYELIEEALMESII